MALQTITPWSIQSPDATVWAASISSTGVVTLTSGGSIITTTAPVFQGDGTTIWTPSIANTGIVTITSGVSASQRWAILLDSLNKQWYFQVTAASLVNLVSRSSTWIPQPEAPGVI
jgi:hypothetical protein